MGQIVLPIFYHVDPTHVRKKLDTFGEAFAKRKQDFRDRKEKALLTDKERKNMENLLKSSEDALTEVANIAGWHLSNRGNEAKFIHEFVLKILRKHIASPNILEDLFGLDSRIKKLHSYVYKLENGVQFVGICGMGSIGKTTLARAFYNLMSSKFEGSSFLANVKDVCKEKRDGLKSLQEHILSQTLNGECTTIWDVNGGTNLIRSRLCHKKVLVVIDDVDQLDQLRKLAGKPDWFGLGSRIVFTTRNENLLIAHGVRDIYKVELFDRDEALRLFSWNAFKNIVCPSDEYAKLSKQVIEYVNGLPLALEILGSSLCGKSINEWKSQLDRLKKNPKKEIIDLLEISFNELEKTDKDIFLDIACFFKGYDSDYVMRILDSCGFHPEIGIRNLIDKSLLRIIDNKFWMHDLLQEMCWKIVRESSHNELGRQSRLWNTDDILHVLKNNKATEEVEAIVCSYLSETCSTQETILSYIEAFSKMKKLRLLKLGGLSFLPSLNYLSNELHFLHWNLCPLKCFPSSFQPNELVILELDSSSINQLWNDNIKPLQNLKVLSLCVCGNLTKIFQNFMVVPNLEQLIVHSCWKLSKIDPSISVLARLIVLDLSGCSGLEDLPTNIKGLESLKVLNLNGCSKLCILPEDIGTLKSLEELDVRKTAIREFPSSIVLLKNLRTLSCGIGHIKEPLDWQNMINTIVGKGNLFPNIGLYSLKKLDLIACNLGEGAIPEELGCLVSLVDLDLSKSSFVSLPASMSKLSNLKSLRLEHCDKLVSLTGLPASLALEVANQCTSLETFLDPLKQYELLCSAFCIGCIELARRQGSERTLLTWLKRYLQQKPPGTSEGLEIILPGCEIPKWFIT